MYQKFFFRGYLTVQFSAWSGSRSFGIVAQAIFFGLCHAYYNRVLMLTVVLLGLALGLLAHWRKSLRPGMLAHGLVDSLGGIIAFFGEVRDGCAHMVVATRISQLLPVVGR